jgi:hypothetical protein
MKSLIQLTAFSVLISFITCEIQIFVNLDQTGTHNFHKLDESLKKFAGISSITWCQDDTDTTISYTLRNFCTGKPIGDEIVLGS